MSRFTTSEQFFIHQDLFVRYVTEKVNPARAAEGLDTPSDGAARHLFAVMASETYLTPNPERAEGRT